MTPDASDWPTTVDAVLLELVYHLIDSERIRLDSDRDLAALHAALARLRACLHAGGFWPADRDR